MNKQQLGLTRVNQHLHFLFEITTTATHKKVKGWTTQLPVVWNTLTLSTILILILIFNSLFRRSKKAEKVHVGIVY